MAERWGPLGAELFAMWNSFFAVTQPGPALASRTLAELAPAGKLNTPFGVAASPVHHILWKCVTLSGRICQRG